MSDYTTVSEVKTYLHIGGTGDDALLADLVSRASRAIDAQCGRWFYSKTETRSFDAVGGHITGRLLLVDTDLLTVTTLTNGDGTVINEVDTILRPINWEPYFGIALRVSSGLHWTYSDDPEGAITVLGDWGYSATPPLPIVQATVRLTAWLYRQRDTGIDTAHIEVDERGTSNAPAHLPKDVISLITPYVRLRASAIT